MNRLKAIFILDSDAKQLVYGDEEMGAINALVDVLHPSLDRYAVADNLDLLGQADILFSGWGAPKIDEAFLSRASKLKIVFYAAGAIDNWATPSLFERGIRVTTAVHANSLPVAEYALSTILFSLKHGWRLSRDTTKHRRFVERDGAPGNFQSTVGLVSLGTVGRLVVNMLKPFDLNVIACDPFLSESEAKLLGVRKVGLKTMFEEADAISLHSPEIAETRGMITGELIALMRHGATLINTARGSLIRQNELIEVLSRRPDLQAVLDVCDPEPPAADCPLFDLPNVLLTPHIAGSAGRECRRMGQYMVQELVCYCSDKPLKWEANSHAAVRAAADTTLQLQVMPRRREKTSAVALGG